MNHEYGRPLKYTIDSNTWLVHCAGKASKEKERIKGRLCISVIVYRKSPSISPLTQIHRVAFPVKIILTSLIQEHWRCAESVVLKSDLWKSVTRQFLLFFTSYFHPWHLRIAGNSLYRSFQQGKGGKTTLTSELDDRLFFFGNVGDLFSTHGTMNIFLHCRVRM